MRIILLGGPGAGKGTQAQKIREYYSIPHISTGDIFREQMSRGTELGEKAAQYINQGKLVPDEIVLGIIAEKLNEPSLVSGFMFDGFPRTVDQAEGLDDLLKKRGKKLDVVLSLEVPDETVIERLLKRAVIEGRSDDNRETIEKRLQVYHGTTEKLKSYYSKKGIFKTVNGVGSVEDVFSRVKSILGHPEVTV